MKLACRAAKDSTAETADTRSDWCYLGILAAGVLSIYLFGVGSFGLIDRADAYYAEGAREMLECGQYLIPQLNYQPFFDKPIFVYWLYMIAFKILGVSAFAARSVSVLFSSALILATYLFGRAVKGKKVGFYAAAVLLCTPLCVGLGRTALVDMPFTALLSASLYLIYLKLSGANRVYGLIAYALLGVSVVAKGPLAIALAGAIIGVFLLLTCRSRVQWLEAVRRLDPIVGTLILCLVMMPWYVVAGLQTGGLWTDAFLLKGNIARFGGKVGHLHPSWFYYLPVLAYAICPWFVFLPAGLPFRSGESTDGRAVGDSNRLRIFLWCWLLVLLVIFSSSKAKLHTYMLPLAPAVSLIVALTFDEWCLKWKKQTEIAPYLKTVSMLFVVAGLILILFSIVLFAGFGDPNVFHLLPKIGEKFEWISSTASRTTQFFMIAAFAVFGAGLMYQNRLLAKGKVEGALGLLIASVAWMCFSASHIGFDLSYKFVGEDLHRVMEVLKDKQDGPIAIIADFKPSLMFYLQRPIESVLNPEQLTVGDANTKTYFIMKKDRFDEFFGKSSGRELGIIASSGKWLVGESHGVKILCLPSLPDLVRQEHYKSGNPEVLLLPFHAGEKPKSR